MRSIAPATGLIDLEFQGHPEYIACYVLEAGEQLLLVDPGPSSTLPALEQGLRMAGLSLEGVTGVLLTHIHLDHAGAAGTLVRRNPGVRVYVHERGARHMIDPTRLLASAARLYGDRMDSLWGEFLAVPEANVVALQGGERLELGTRRLEVAYTPGHAVHHLSFFEPGTGLAWVGDTLGIRIDNRPFVLPVTPPPDIDIEAWEDGVAKIRAWQPAVLCPTHFGPARPAAGHLDEHRDRLRHWAATVRSDLASGHSDAEAAARFRDQCAEELRRRLGPPDVQLYLAGGGLTDSWHGLARYFRKRQDPPGQPDGS